MQHSNFITDPQNWFTKEILKGEYMGDFHAEPSFGFVDIK